MFTALFPLYSFTKNRNEKFKMLKILKKLKLNTMKIRRESAIKQTGKPRKENTTNIIYQRIRENGCYVNK